MIHYGISILQWVSVAHSLANFHVTKANRTEGTTLDLMNLASFMHHVDKLRIHETSLGKK